MAEDFKQHRPVVYSNTLLLLVAIIRTMPNINFCNNDKEIDSKRAFNVIQCMEDRAFHKGAAGDHEEVVSRLGHAGVFWPFQ